MECVVIGIIGDDIAGRAAVDQQVGRVHADDAHVKLNLDKRQFRHNAVWRGSRATGEVGSGCQCAGRESESCEEGRDSSVFQRIQFHKESVHKTKLRNAFLLLAITQVALLLESTSTTTVFRYMGDVYHRWGGSGELFFQNCC